jgi:hypothetical protein
VRSVDGGRGLLRGARYPSPSRLSRGGRSFFAPGSEKREAAHSIGGARGDRPEDGEGAWPVCDTTWWMWKPRRCGQPVGGPWTRSLGVLRGHKVRIPHARSVKHAACPMLHPAGSCIRPGVVVGSRRRADMGICPRDNPSSPIHPTSLFSPFTMLMIRANSDRGMM